MTTAAKPKTPPRDRAESAEYLCFCMGVRAEEWRRLSQAHDHDDVASLLLETGVGTHCTACVQDAEYAFLEARSGGAGDTPLRPADKAARAGSVGAAAAAAGPGLLRRLLDRLSPQIGTRMRSFFPVVAGPGARTLLSVENGAAPPIACRLPVMTAKIELRGLDGRPLYECTHRIAPGARLDLDVSALVSPAGAPGGSGAFDGLGVAARGRIALRAKTAGHVGAIRPHISVATEGAATSVHTVDAGDQVSRHLFDFGPAEVENGVFVVNAAKGANETEIRILRDGRGEPVWRERIAVPKDGAAWVALPRAAGAEGLHLVEVSAAGVQRSFFLCGDRSAISVDHI